MNEMQWRLVSQELPEIDQVVLYWSLYSNGVKCGVLVVDFMGATLTHFATHWMPLPEPPLSKSDIKMVQDRIY